MKKNTNDTLGKWLIGSYVDKVIYYITGWELFFINENHRVSSIFCEINTIIPQSWDTFVENSPINITNTNEPEDTINSIAIFTIINSHPIIKANIDSENNLIIEFENKTKIRIPSNSETEECAWLLKEEKGDKIYCEWGNIVTMNKCFPDHLHEK